MAIDRMYLRVPVAIKAKVTQDLKLKIVADCESPLRN
jgi:hypothetical protein